MAAQGQTFDGLNSTPINVSVSAQAKFFNASGTDPQYRTMAANMAFKTAGSQPTYSFTDTFGTTLNSTLQAGTLTLANKFTTNKGGNVITGANGDTLPGLTIQGSSFTSTVSPFKINNTSYFGSADIEQVTGEYPALALTLNGSGYGVYNIQRSLATNMTSSNILQHTFGKDTSSNANAFYLRYQYDNSESFRNFSIQAHGAPSRSLEIRKSDITGTDASTASIIVNGGIATDTMRVGGSGITFFPSRLTSSGVTLKSSASSSNYTLILPSNIGTTNDYLQLGSSGTGQLQWAPGGSSVTGSIATLQGLTSTFTVPVTSNAAYNGEGTTGTDTVVVFGTLLYNINTGLEYNTSGAANANYFKNISGGTIYVDVNVYVKMPSNGAGSNRFLEIRKVTSTNVAPGSGTVIAVYKWTMSSSVAGFAAVNGLVSLAANECFLIAMPQATSTAIPNTYVNIWATVVGGGGAQSVTLNLSDSNTQAIFTTNGQQTGQNPAVNLGFATTPTGTGSQLVRATAPTISNLTTTGTTIGDIEKVNALGLMKSTDPTIVTTIKTNSSTTSSFDFVLPVNNGSAGQFLTSTGLTGALSWSNTCASLSLNGLLPGITTTIKANSTITSFDFILPTSLGSTGQFLTSNGAGNPLIWSSAIPSNQPITITVLGSYIGTSTLENGSISQPSLMINGTTPNSTSAAPLVVNNYNTVSQNTTCLAAFAPQIPNFTNTAIRFGRTTSNSGDLQYYYETSGSDYNYIGLQHYSQIPTMKIFKPNLTTPAVTIAGGLTATKFTCSGEISGTNLTASGIVTATTNVNTPKVLVSSKNSTFGSENTILNSSSEYICDISGTCASITTQPILRVQNHQLDITTTDSTTIGAYSPNMPLNYSSYIRFGKNLVSARNHARLGYTYIGDGSSSNFASVGLYAENDSIKIYKVNTSSTGTSTGTLVVTGDIGCSNITTGTCTASTVSSTNISSTNISTTNLTVGGNDYTPSSGTQTDLTIWWAYNTSDPSSTNLQYPSIPGQGGGTSGNIQNQRYYWQQIGKSYTFSLNFYCTFDNTSLQMHMLFLRMNSHTPPIPASGSYTTNLTADAGTTESFASQVKFGLGTYIPAM